MTSPPNPAGKEIGKRLKELRVALGYAGAGDMAKETERVAAELGGSPISAANLRNMETRGIPQDVRPRSILAATAGLPAPVFDAYIAGTMTLDEAMKKREPGGFTSGSYSTPPPASRSGAVLGPLLKTHPNWGDMCARVVLEDPYITPETLAIVGQQPFTATPVEQVDLPWLVNYARGMQAYLARRSRRP